MALRQGPQAVRRQEPVLGQHLAQQLLEPRPGDDAQLQVWSPGAPVTKPPSRSTLAGDMPALHEAGEPLAERLRRGRRSARGTDAAGRSGMQADHRMDLERDR